MYINAMENEKTNRNENHGRLKKMVAVRFGLAVPTLAAMFFLPAGTLN